MRHIHSGSISYLNSVHKKKYGGFNYWMKHLKSWSDGKMTVEFVPYDEKS